MLNSKEAAQYIGVSENYFRNIRQGITRYETIPCVKYYDGQRTWCMYNRYTLQEWMEKYYKKRKQK